MGIGKSILLGLDSIVGLEDSYVLSSELVTYLNDYGLYTLNHALNLGGWSKLIAYWLDVEYLEFFGT